MDSIRVVIEKADEYEISIRIDAGDNKATLMVGDDVGTNVAVELTLLDLRAWLCAIGGCLVSIGQATAGE